MSYRRTRSRRGGSIVNTNATCSGRKALRLFPEPVFLEDRTLLSFTLPQVMSTFDTGAAAIGTATKAAAIVDQVLGLDTLPLAEQTLDQALGITADFLAPFLTNTKISDTSTDWSDTVEPELAAAGFLTPITLPYSPNPTTISGYANLGSNNLLAVTWSQTVSANDLIQILGNTGLSYLDGAGGGLFGAINATGSVTVNLTMGVDVNAANQLNFFVVPAGNVVQASLTSSTSNGAQRIAQHRRPGQRLRHRDRGDQLHRALGLQASSADTDGKLRIADLTTNLATDKVVTGPGVSGTGTVDVSQFSLQLFGFSLPVTWAGTISLTVTNNAIQPEVDDLTNIPTPSALLGTLGSSLFSLGDGIPILGSLSNTLNQPLPLIGESIAQLTGLDNDLPTLPSLPSSFSSYNGNYSVGGRHPHRQRDADHDRGVPPGQMPSLSSPGRPPATSTCSTRTSPSRSTRIGVPDIASVELDATFGIHASLDYNVGFGLDGHGFYALAGTPSDPTLGLTFGVTAGVQGQVEVFGLPLAEAGGDIGFSVTPYVALTPAPASVDPDTDPGKVYMSDLALFGKDPFTDILDDLSAGIEGDFTGDLYASIDLLFFSLSWNWGISIPVFNYERSPTWPGPSGSGSGVTPWPNVTQHGTVLTFNGTAAADNVTLTQGANNTLTVGWSNAPSGYATSETFTGVTSFVFNGGSGTDTLTAAPGLDHARAGRRRIRQRHLRPPQQLRQQHPHRRDRLEHPVRRERATT